MTNVRNVDQLRSEIDAGRTGDKVAWPDPAAAPLGTDEEAGGAPPTRDQVRLAQRLEGEPEPSGRKAVAGGLGPAWWIIGVATLIGSCAVAVPILTR